MSNLDEILDIIRDYEEFQDIIYSTMRIPRIIIDKVIDTEKGQKLRYISFFPPRTEREQKQGQNPPRNYSEINVRYPSLLINGLELVLGITHLSIKYAESIFSKNLVFVTNADESRSDLTIRSSRDISIDIKTILTQLTGLIVSKILTEFIVDHENEIPRLLYYLLNMDKLYPSITMQIDNRQKDEKLNTIMEVMKEISEIHKEIFSDIQNSTDTRDESIKAIREMYKIIRGGKISIKKCGLTSEKISIDLLSFLKELTGKLIQADILSPLLIEFILRIVSTSGLRRIDPVKFLYILTRNINICRKDGVIEFFIDVNEKDISDRFLDIFLSFITTYYLGFYAEPYVIEYMLSLINKEKSYLVIPIETETLSSEKLQSILAEEIRDIMVFDLLYYSHKCTIDSLISLFINPGCLSKICEDTKLSRQHGISINTYMQPMYKYYKRTITKIFKKEKYTERINVRLSYRTPTLIGTTFSYRSKDLKELVEKAYKSCLKLIADYKIDEVIWGETVKDIISMSTPLIIIEFNKKTDLEKEILRNKIIKELKEAH